MKILKMKSVLKLILIIPVLLLMFTIIGSWFVFEYKKEWIKEELLLLVNSSFYGDFSVDRIGYDAFTYFPKVALTLHNTNFYENKNREAAKEIFSVDKVVLDFNLKELITNSKLSIQSVSIGEGSLNLIQDKKTGWNIANGFKGEVEKVDLEKDIISDSPFVLDIEKLNLNHLWLSIQVEDNDALERFHFSHVKADLKYKEDVLDINIISEQEIMLSVLKKAQLKYLGNTKLKSTFSIDIDKERINVTSGELSFKDENYNFKGYYDFKQNHDIKVQFKGFSENMLQRSPFAEGTFFTSIGKRKQLVEVSLDAYDIDVNQAFNDYSSNELVKGNVDLNLDWIFKGNDFSKFFQNSKADIILKGENITLYGMELDPLLKNYKKSQNFSLVDVGAFAFAGPFGAVAVKSSEFTKLLTTKYSEVDSTKIQEIVIDLEMMKGVIQTNDVAFSTEKNRIALFGSYDVVKDTIPESKIVVLTDRACEVLSQKFYGKPSQIQLEEVKVVKTLMGSVLNLFRTVTLQKCEPVYFGSVRHPDTAKESYLDLNGNTVRKVLE